MVGGFDFASGFVRLQSSMSQVKFRLEKHCYQSIFRIKTLEKAMLVKKESSKIMPNVMRKHYGTNP